MASALQRMSMLATGALAAVLSAAFLTPTANAEQTGFSSRQPIVGGQPVSIAEHPWVVYLVDTQGNQYCGGTLAKENKVVTAAHCVHSETPESLQVVAGREDKRSNDGVVAAVTDIWVHPQFQNANRGSDVAVLTLDQNLPYESLPLASARDDGLYQPDTPASVFGWGATSEGGAASDVLRKADVQVIGDQDCQSAYPQYRGDRMVCAGVPQGGIDSCQGDSGGPLVAGGKLIGIVSTGSGCARPGYPGVYTKVAAYHDDIAAQLGA